MKDEEYVSMLEKQICIKCKANVVIIPQPYQPDKLQAVCVNCNFKLKEEK